MTVQPTANARFLTGSTMGHVARMTLAGTLGLSFIFLVDAVNLFWLSQLGAPRLVAAIGFAFAIQYFSVSSGIGLMIAATALVARHIGAGDRAQARRQAASAMVIAAIAQTIVAALILTYRNELVALTGATGETAALTVRYLILTVPSLGIMVVAMVANATLRATGDARRTMLVTLISGLVSMVLDPPLIWWLGLDGAAIGLVISRIVMLMVAFRYAIAVHDLIARPRWADMRSCLRPYLWIAGPVIVTQMATPVGNYIITSVMAGFGDDAVAGWAVVGRLTVLGFGGIFALSGAIGGIFGQNYGAQKWDRLRNVYRDSLIFGALYAIAVWALLWAMLPLILTAFDLPAAGQNVVRAFVHFGAGAVVIASAIFVASAAFNSLGKPGYSTVINWLRDGVLLLPLALWAASHFDAPGAIYGQALAGVIVGVIAAIWGWVFMRNLAPATSAPVDARPTPP
jgi:putative MATE family efflux protein